jgi:hypothetical protein
VSPTKDIPSTPSLVEAAEHGLCREVTDFILLENLVPRIFGIDDEFVPNTLFDFFSFSLKCKIYRLLNILHSMHES